MRLTDHLRTILQAAIDCDSISSKRFRLQDLNRLANMDLLEPFDSEPDFGNPRRLIVKFTATAEGREAINAPKPVMTIGVDKAKSNAERTYYRYPFFNADCPACLRGHAHTEDQHYEKLNRVFTSSRGDW